MQAVSIQLLPLNAMTVRPTMAPVWQHCMPRRYQPEPQVPTYMLHEPKKQHKPAIAAFLSESVVIGDTRNIAAVRCPWSYCAIHTNKKEHRHSWLRKGHAWGPSAGSLSGRRMQSLGAIPRPAGRPGVRLSPESEPDYSPEHPSADCCRC